MVLNNTHHGSILPGGSSGRTSLSDTALRWSLQPEAEISGPESSVLQDSLIVDFSGFSPNGWDPFW